jgi:hypothetical protein
MATVTIPYTFSNGNPIVAAEHNSNWQAIANYSNGLSAGDNFDTGAIDTVSIADAAITTAKLATGLSLTTPTLGVATATSIAVTGNVVYHMETNQQATGYTLALSDDGKIVEINSPTGVNVTVPLASSVAFPIGTFITLIQVGAGQVTVAGATGAVTVNATPGLKLRAQWSTASLVKRSSDTWILMGDLSS